MLFSAPVLQSFQACGDRTCTATSLDKLQDHFAPVVAPDVYSQIAASSDYNPQSFLNSYKSSDGDIILKPFPEEVMWKELCNLDVHKACGSDSIPLKYIKFAADVIASPITKIFNKSLESATHPDDWKRGSVSPIHKGGSPLDANNYRPITLLPIISKVMKRLVRRQIAVVYSRKQSSKLLPECISTKSLQ